MVDKKEVVIFMRDRAWDALVEARKEYDAAKHQNVIATSHAQETTESLEASRHKLSQAQQKFDDALDFAVHVDDLTPPDPYLGTLAVSSVGEIVAYPPSNHKY